MATNDADDSPGSTGAADGPTSTGADDAARGFAELVHEAARRARERSSELFERSPVPHLLVTRTGVIVELNAAAAELLDRPRPQLVGKPLCSAAGLQRALLLAHLEACAAGRRAAPVLLEVAPRGGAAPRLVHVDGQPILDLVDEHALVLLTMSADGSRRAPAAAAQLLLDVAAAGASSLDPSAVVEHVAGAMVPGLADLCVVDLVQGCALARRAAVRHVDPERAERFRQVEERWGVLPNLSFATLQALQTGQAQVIPVMSPAYLEAAAVDAEHFTALIGLVLRSWVVVPLTGAGQALGAVRLATAGVRAPFDQADVQLASRAAALAARALANARAHEAARTRSGASELQGPALVRALEEAVRSLARVRSGLPPRSSVGLEIGHAAGRVRAVIRDLQAGSLEGSTTSHEGSWRG